MFNSNDGLPRGIGARQAREAVIEKLRAQNARLRAELVAVATRLAKRNVGGEVGLAGLRAAEVFARRLATLGRLALWPRTVGSEDGGGHKGPRSTLSVVLGQQYRPTALDSPALPGMARTSRRSEQTPNRQGSASQAPHVKPGATIYTALSRHVWRGMAQPPPIPAQLRRVGLCPSTSAPADSSMLACSSSSSASWAYCVTFYLELYDETKAQSVIAAAIKLGQAILDTAENGDGEIKSTSLVAVDASAAPPFAHFVQVEMLFGEGETMTKALRKRRARMEQRRPSPTTSSAGVEALRRTSPRRRRSPAAPAAPPAPAVAAAATNDEGSAAASLPTREEIAAASAAVAARPEPYNKGAAWERATLERHGQMLGSCAIMLSHPLRSFVDAKESALDRLSGQLRLALPCAVTGWWQPQRHYPSARTCAVPDISDDSGDDSNKAKATAATAAAARAADGAGDSARSNEVVSFLTTLLQACGGATASVHYDDLRQVQARLQAAAQLAADAAPSSAAVEEAAADDEFSYRRGDAPPREGERDSSWAAKLAAAGLWDIMGTPGEELGRSVRQWFVRSFGDVEVTSPICSGPALELYTAVAQGEPHLISGFPPSFLRMNHLSLTESACAS